MTKNLKEALSYISKIHEKGNRFIVEQLNKNGIKELVPSHGDILAVLYKDGKTTMKEIADKIIQENGGFNYKSGLDYFRLFLHILVH